MGAPKRKPHRKFTQAEKLAYISEFQDAHISQSKFAKEHGLNLLCTPGNDLVATTTLGCAGCQMVLFTTGRGTPFGGFIPTVKVATNTTMATKKSNWIDFNAGDLVDKYSMNELLEKFIDLICDIASGRTQTKNEKNNFREISIFKDGVVL